MPSDSPPRSTSEDLRDSTASTQPTKPDSNDVLLGVGAAHLHESSVCEFNMKLENGRLRGQIKQLQFDLKSEQETITSLRKKLMESGKEKLEVVSRCTAETSALMTANTSMRVELERREETMQQLQFQVNQLQRQLGHEAQIKAKRDEKYAEDVEVLEERLEEVSRRHDAALQQAAEQRARLAADLELFSGQLGERDRAIAACRLERANLEAEKGKLAELVQQQSETIASLQDSMRLLEGELARQKESCKHILADVEHLRNREREAGKELESAKLKIKSLEECIEAERSAHLESRFSSEIVQLKFRDLEVAIENEKQAKMEAMSKTERLHSHLRDVEEAYTDERKQCKAALEKLDKMEKEFANAQKKLQSELADKKNLVAGLTEQLEIHQQDVDALKAELQRAKKKQVSMEDTYGGNAKGLELLLDDFNIGVDKQRWDLKSSRIPAAMLDALRHALGAYKKDSEFTSEELQKLRHLCNCLTKEADTYKDALNASQEALQDAQRSADHAKSELTKVKTDLSLANDQIMMLKDQLQVADRNLSKECNMAKEQHNELSAAIAESKRNSDEHGRFLKGLHQRLSFVVGYGNSAVLPHLGGGDPSASNQLLQSSAASSSITPSDMNNIVLDQVISITAELLRLRDKAKSWDERWRSHEKMLADVRKECDEQLCKLRAASEAHESKLRERLDEAEQRCAKLTDEMRQKSKATQKMAAEAWGKVKQTGQLQQELENECADLRAKVLLFSGHQKALHTAFILLAGAYYPLAARARDLADQRDVLNSHLHRMQSFKQQACHLWSTLSSSDAVTKSRATAGSSPGTSTSPAVTSGSPADWRGRGNCGPTSLLLRFRVAAVAVMAVQRLRCRLQKPCRRVFTFSDRSGGQHIVHMGTSNAHGDAGSKGQRQQVINKGLVSESDILDWLTSKDLLATIIACTEDIQEVVGKMMETESFIRPGLLITTLSNSFTKLIGRLEPLYNGSLREDSGTSPRGCKDAAGLAHILGRGLQTVLNWSQVAGATDKQQLCFGALSAETIMNGLQQQTLALVRRLHSSESDRRRVRQELGSAQKRLEECEHRAAESERLRAAMLDENARLNRQLDEMVQQSTYEGICKELNDALDRERSAQQLLRQQSQQLSELTERADADAAKAAATLHSLREAEQAAACHRAAMQREEESVQQLTVQIARVDTERKSLREDVYEAERALRAAVRNRDMVVNYLKAVNAALQQYSNDGNWYDLPRLLLSSDLLPLDITGVEEKTAELAACSSAVVSFASVLQRAGLQASALQAEVSAHRSHVMRLKEELSAACHRELGVDEFSNAKQAYHAIPAGNHTKSLVTHSSSEKEEDQYAPLPLQEDSEASFAMAAHVSNTASKRPVGAARLQLLSSDALSFQLLRGNSRTPTMKQK